MSQEMKEEEEVKEDAKEKEEKVKEEEEEYSLDQALFSLDKLPLFCDEITHRMACQNASYEGTTFVDKDTFTLIDETVELEIARAGKEITDVLALCHAIGLEYENIISERMKFPEHSPWQDANLLLSPCRMERVVGIICTTARVEWVISCLVDRRLQLKDNLSSPQIADKLGYLAVILQCLLGSVKGFNIKNLSWHGFVSSRNIPKHICSLLFCAVVKLNDKTKDMTPREHCKDLNLLELPETPENPQLSRDQVSREQVSRVISSSRLIHPEHRELWQYLVHHLHSYHHLSLNVMLLQHCLRRLWVAATRSDPLRCVAHSGEFYITLDEIFSPLSMLEVIPRPGASYFSTVAKIAGRAGGGGENVLIPILGEDVFAALLDLFVHGGMRVRDKLSHGECRDIESPLVNHMLHLSLCILSSFAERNISPLSFTYASQLHPRALLNKCLVKQHAVADKLSVLAAQYSTQLSPKTTPELITELQEQCEFLEATLPLTSTAQISTLYYIGPDKMKFYNLLQSIEENKLLFIVNLSTTVESRLDCLAARTLRSRQRENLSVIIALIPVYVRVLALSPPLLEKTLKRVEADESSAKFLRNLKHVLKYFQNCASNAAESKWNLISSALLQYLDDMRNL